MTIAVGDRAPHFELKNQHGRMVKLSELLEHEPVMVVFLPLAFSAGCTNEVETLQRERQRFVDAGLTVVMISVDSTATLRAWADAGGYKFSFLSDFWPHGAVAHSFGVLREDRGFASRVSFLIDRSSIIRCVIEAPLDGIREFSEYEDAISVMEIAEWR
ncbi:Alkyl hydroperoxide reductase subunit C-like protein [Leifsonia rubra CMS 76R]|nr:Alkyl hydroperoxide reductase subunit C-like protein [Leifsonia rubra CMS 76R]